MKLLILTQKVDKQDSVLGFFHGWLEEFAKHCESVVVVCLEKGEYGLPDNVRVLSLGKEKKLSRFVYILNFYRLIFSERKNYDTVFVHMNPEYVVLGGFFWRILGKKIGLWYVHRQVNLKLRIAEKFVHHIFTVAKESFRIKSKKVHMLGHAIDTEKFFYDKNREINDPISIISVGRITKIKNLDILIQAAVLLKKRLSKKFIINIVGETVTDEDREYYTSLKKQVVENGLGDIVNFSGAVPYSRMPEQYSNSDISINLAPTGGIDKAVLESMSCGTPVLVSNKAFVPFFGRFADDLVFLHRDLEDLAKKLVSLIDSPKDELPDFLRKQILNHHNKQEQIKKIVSFLEGK